MALYGIHWQMTDMMRRDLPDGGLGLITDQLLDSARGEGAIVKEGAKPEIGWFELDEMTADLLNKSLASRGFDVELCTFEAGDWMIRATIETENGPG